jgi:hypothetical protein
MKSDRLEIMMNLFTKPCDCGGIIFGPRMGGKARGEWLGYDRCLQCREKADQASEPKSEAA